MEKGRRARIAIVGSREYPDLKAVVDYVNGLHERTVIVSGLAKGVDSTARVAALNRGMNVIDIPAVWSQGRGAGFRRNGLIVETADEITAFWDGESRGTKHTIDLAKKEGKQIHVYRPVQLS